MLIFPFVPESPRWLIYRDRHEDALESLALTQADGRKDDPIVLAQYAEITDTIRFEKEAGKTVSLLTMIKTPSSRKRMMLALSVAVCAILSGKSTVQTHGQSPYVKRYLSLTGNNFVSYYLSLMLNNAGIKDTTTQLEIVSPGYNNQQNILNMALTSLQIHQNIILNAWCLVIALLGTFLSDHIGRKPQALISTALLTIFLFCVGALTKGNTSFTDRCAIVADVL